MLASRWPGKVKMLLMVREPADFLWAAYNIWTLVSVAFVMFGTVSLPIKPNLV